MQRQVHLPRCPTPLLPIQCKTEIQCCKAILRCNISTIYCDTLFQRYTAIHYFNGILQCNRVPLQCICYSPYIGCIGQELCWSVVFTCSFFTKCSLAHCILLFGSLYCIASGCNALRVAAAGCASAQCTPPPAPISSSLSLHCNYVPTNG